MHDPDYEPGDNVGNQVPLEELRPKTMKSLKRIATKLKKRDGIKHHEALDKASVLAGFRNFHEASKNLRDDQ